MFRISSRKRERIKKKVIPHLRKAIDYYNRDLLANSKRELSIASTNLRKEKVFPLEILHDLAALYNNLGVKHVKKRNFEKAFKLFSKSLPLKMKYEPNDLSSIEGTFKNMFNTALMCCKFDYLSNIIERLLNTYSSEEDFTDYLQMCLKKTKMVQNNEPGIFVAGIHFGVPSSTHPIDDPVYFPRVFEDIEVDLGFQLTLSDHATLDCSFVMIPKNGNRKIHDPYEQDSWKKIRPPHLEPKIEMATPNLTIFLSENEHIPGNTIKVKDRSGTTIEHQFKIAFTEFFIPDSYPRFGYSFGDPPRIPYCKSFKYFRGKAGVLEWKMNIGEEYKIQLCVKNYDEPCSTDNPFNMRIGILTPFKGVKFDKSYFRHTNKITVETIKQKMIKYFDDRDRPGAILLGAEPNSISEKQFSNSSAPSNNANKKSYDIKPEPDFILSDYSIFGLSIHYRMSHEALSIATFEWEQPIPTALSHLLMDERFGFPPLCRYVIINNSKEEAMLTLSTEIEGFTNKQEDTKVILPYSIEHVNHTPIFKMETKSIRETFMSNLKIRAMLGKEAITQKTIKIRLLASDTMIWEILNPLTRDNFNLHDFVAIWVTPHSGSIEEILSIAKELHPLRVLRGYPENLSREQIQKSTNVQCKAIFQALKSIGLSYVDSSISFGWLKPYASQRVKLPSVTIETKAANCIDGTVLFASLLENIGIEPIIVLIPRHALIGWRPYPNSKEIVVLETTQIAFKDFDTAIKSGQESVNRCLEDARKILRTPKLTIEDAVRRGYFRLIDVKHMRQKGVFPQPQHPGKKEGKYS